MRAILHKDNNENNVLTYIADNANIAILNQELEGVVCDTKELNIEFINCYDISDDDITFNDEKYKLELASQAKIKLLNRLDDFAAVMPRNETYPTPEERESFKEKVRSFCKSIRDVDLPSLESKTVKELTAILEDSTTVEDLLKQ